ncbi:MAG: YesL family protein [Oscillospiraceae bacterium]|nr:YesL family protein [Oscillospiraceae bacterium]
MERQNNLKDSLLTFFHNLFDLMVVNMLWLLCCLPVITIGPAVCGMYTVTLKLAREEAVNPVKDFFLGFKRNFKSGLLLGLIALLLPVIVAGDAFFALQRTGALRNVYLVVAVMTGVIWLIFISFTFALQAMFENPLKIQILNAFKLAAVAPGKTVILWLILLIPVIAALVLPPVAIEMLGFLYLVVGFSGPAYGASRILRNIFDRVNGAPVADASPTTEK